MINFTSVFKDELATYLLSYSKNSYYTYMHIQECLLNFDSFLEKENLNKKEITIDLLDRWISSISVNTSINTIHSKVITLNKFLLSLIGLGYKVDLATVPKDQRNYIPYIFSDTEVEGIINYIDNSYELIHNPKSVFKYQEIEVPIVIRIIIYCGTRLVETLSIKYSDVDFERNLIYLRNTKLKKERIVIMDPELTKMITRYVNFMNLSDGDYLFPGKTTEDYLIPACVTRIFNKAKESINLSVARDKPHDRGACIHCLRHYFVLKAFKKGIDNGISVESSIPYLSYYLGHDDLSETEKYMRFSSELFPNEMNQFSEYSKDIFPEDI